MAFKTKDRARLEKGKRSIFKPFKSYEDKKLGYQDYYDTERFDREEKRFANILATRFFLIPFNVIYGLLVCFITNYLTTLIYGIYSNYFQHNAPHTLSGLFLGKGKADFYNIIKIWNIFNFTSMYHILLWLALSVVSIGFQIKFSLLIYHRFVKRANNQLGEARFANKDETYKLLPLAPDNSKTFNGYGGAPLFHLNSQNIPNDLRKKYNIPKGFGAYGYTPPSMHSHKLVIGTSGSAKGQTYVMPLIDLLSRALKKVSMLINDPKSENLDLFYKILRKRGYDVKVINLIDPMDSMSYNPLQLAISYVKNGQYDNVQKEINSLSYTLYHDEKASDKHWQISAQSLFNSLALALLDYCEAKNDYSKATIINVSKMLSSLGSASDENSKLGENKTELDTYFNRLIQKQDNKHSRWSKLAEMAIQEYSISGFAGDNEAGSIKSTTMAGLEIYNQDKIARMTSKNSFNLGRLGFPRHLDGFLGKEFAFKDIILSFMDSNSNKVIENFKTKVDESGRFSYEIENKLNDTTILDVSILDTNYQVSYKLSKKYKLDDLGNLIRDEYTNEPQLESTLDTKIIDSNIEHKTYIDIEYKEKPTAVFLVTPAYDSAYNQITSFFVSQAYKANVEAATSRARGRKVYIPIEIILDEFGNLPQIDDMDTKITIARSYGIIFDLILQNFKQLNNKYGDNLASIIKGNCGTWTFIKTDDVATAKEFQERLGNKTIQLTTMNGDDTHVQHGNSQQNIQKIELMTIEELMNLKEGETIVLATMNRRDVYGNKIVPKPIFNRFDGSMPFAYKLLDQTMDSNTTLQDIKQDSQHRYLQVGDNTVTSNQFKLFSISTDFSPTNEHKLIINVLNGNESVQAENFNNSPHSLYLFDDSKINSSEDYKQEVQSKLANIVPQTKINDRLTIIKAVENNTLDELTIDDFQDEKLKSLLSNTFDLKDRDNNLEKEGV